MFKIKALGLVLCLMTIFWLFGGRLTFAVFTPDPDPGGNITVHAPITNSLYYDPPSINYPGTAALNGRDTPYFVVGNDKSYNYDARMYVYATSGRTLDLTVNNAGAGCQTAPPSGGAAGGPDYGQNNPTSVGPTTNFEVLGPNGKFGNTITRTGAQCSGATFPTLNITSTNSYPIKDWRGRPISVGGYDHYVVLYAYTPLASPIGENSFRISSSSDVGFSSKITGFGFRDKSVAQWHTWTAQVTFGLLGDCTDLGLSSNQTIDFKDLDIHPSAIYGDPNLELALQSRPYNSTSWSVEKSSWQPSTNSGSFTYNYSTLRVYRLLIKNVSTRNTINIGLGPGLSQLATKYNPTIDDCVSCNVTTPPSGTAIFNNQTTSVTITGKALQPSVNWVPNGGSGYYLKRIGASDHIGPLGQIGENNYAILGGNGPAYTDTVNPPAWVTGSVTYTYGVYDSNFPSPYFTGQTCYVTYPVSPTSSNPFATPYFQVWQNDAAAGGGFMNGDSCTNTSYPAYVSPGSAQKLSKPSYQYYGGIRGIDATKSKTDFGAVALGLIPPTTSGEGFSSANNTIFANVGVPGGASGYFNASDLSLSPTRLYHCATDFYGTTMINNPSPTPVPGNNLNSVITSCSARATNPGRCQYQLTSDITSTVLIPAGVQITLYASGSINIKADIMYSQTFNPNVRFNIPYFALIVKGGDITLANSVTQLDGLYVAQPTVGIGLTGGDFNTCDNNPCPDQLIVNGAVIAQHVKLLRAHGTSLLNVGNAAVGGNPAEIFNFVPSMVLGVPALSPQTPNLVSPFSLPPVF